MIHPRCALFYHDTNYIKSQFLERPLASGQIIEGRFSDVVPFPPGDRFFRRTIKLAGAGFHLYKYYYFSLAANYVDLPALAAIIPLQDTVALFLQIGGRQVLSLIAQFFFHALLQSIRPSLAIVPDGDRYIYVSKRPG